MLSLSDILQINSILLAKRKVGGDRLAVKQNRSLPSVKVRFTADGTASDGIMATKLRQQSGNFMIRAPDRRAAVTLEVSAAAESLLCVRTKPADRCTIAKVAEVASDKSDSMVLVLNAGLRA